MDQHFGAGFETALPPIMGLDSGNQVRTRDEPRFQGRTGKLARDSQIRRGYQDNGKLPMRFCGHAGSLAQKRPVKTTK